jgi:hypothetical protein
MTKALCYKPELSRFETQWGEWIFFNLPNPSAALGPRANSASNKNEYQKILLGCKVRPVRRADNLAAICELIV